MNEQLVDRIRQCPNLPSLPAIALQVLQLAQREDVDISEIARAISKDPALSGKILKTVNSSFYGRAQAVSTISHALVILGLQSVKSLVLGFTLVKSLGGGRGKGFKHLQYWRRSIYAATAARSAAAKALLVQQEEAFLAALLQDIGMLVLDAVLGEQYNAVCAKAASHEELAAAEQAELGLTHADAGGVLAQQWKLPPLLAIPIAHHHNPAGVEDPTLQKLAELVQLSGRCAEVFAEEPDAAAIARARGACAAYGLNESESEALLEEVGTRTREVASLFEINLGTPQEYDVVLKRANEAMERLARPTRAAAAAPAAAATAAVELPQAAVATAAPPAAPAPAPATGQHGLSGHSQNASRSPAVSSAPVPTVQPIAAPVVSGPPATLVERTAFDAFLAEHFGVALGTGNSLSMLVTGLDAVQALSGSFGAAAPERAMGYIGRLLATAARPLGLAARLGPHTICVALPGATRAAAVALAENVRRAASARPAPLDGERSSPLTICIGVATLEPGSRLTDPAHLTRAAELALAAARRAGPNRVRVFSLGQPTATSGAAA
jgi:two-component system, cell cycle response regulator